MICLDWSLSRWMETQQRVADDVHILTWVLNSLRTINTESGTELASNAANILILMKGLIETMIDLSYARADSVVHRTFLFV